MCPVIRRKNTKTHKTHALFICPFEAEEKHKNTQNTKGVAPVLFGPHHTFTTKPKKYKKTKPKKYKNTSNTGLLQFLNRIKNTQNTWVVWTSLQYCLLAHLHVGVKKYKNTQWLTIFFCIHGKKHKNTQNPKNTKTHQTQAYFNFWIE